MKNSSVLIITAFFVGQVIGKDKLEFNRDIRPILSDACFHCHGPDEKERKGGLRLDLESHAYKAGKSGFEAIIRGMQKIVRSSPGFIFLKMILSICPLLKVERHLLKNKRKF